MRRGRANLADPTIPRKEHPGGTARQRQRVSGATTGRLVDYGDRLVLVDSRGNDLNCATAAVRYLAGSFGSRLEGTYAPPRPWVYKGDKPLIEGDQFLIVYLDSDPTKPVLIGGVQHLKPDDPEFLPPNQIGADPNPRRMRMARLNDATGTVLGHCDVTALDGGNQLEVTVGGGSFGSGVRLVVDYDAGTIQAAAGTVKLGEGGHPVPLGDTMLAGLAPVVEAVNLMAVAVNALAPGTITPDLLIGLAQALVDLNASVSAGAPYLSLVSETE